MLRTELFGVSVDKILFGVEATALQRVMRWAFRSTITLA